MTLSVGDRVQLAGDPDRIGTVIAAAQSVGARIYYQVVFHGDAEPQFCSEDELVVVAHDANNPASWLLAQPLADAAPFSEYYTLLKLQTRLSDHLYSYLSSRTVFRVYQFKPVLKLLGSPYARLLIADEVGLGKTIEAGLIWSELDSRTALDRVLVVCPGGLRRKWQVEMDRRFDREVQVIASSRQLDELLQKYARQGSSSRFSAIVGLETLRSRRSLELLRATSPTLDLVIVDEAHHMRNTGTFNYQVGEFLSEAADSLVFLTATPLNLGTPDLFNLVNLLVPEEFDSIELFDELLEPNRFINDALRQLRSTFPPDAEAVAQTLKKVEDTRVARRFQRNPYYQDIVSALESGGVADRRAVVEIQRKLTELNTLGMVYTRTRKRDLAEKFAMRQPATLAVEWTEREWAVYNAATDYVVSRFRRVHASGAPLGFVAIMPQRQAASCLPVMRDYLLDVLERRQIEMDPEEGEEELEGETSLRVDDKEMDALEKALEAAKALGLTDSKFEVFANDLRRILAEEPKAQMLVFSFFRRTLTYLQQNLLALGFDVRKMDGSTDRGERETLMEGFRAGEFQILLSSEIGAEGLDFEFCRYLFNYDLPWNPMRLEQRIGRLDRFGQHHDKIVIVNFQIPGTIETDVFERLYERIGIFRASIGELEPILGDAVRELEKTILSPELTPAQRRQETERIAQNVEARKSQIAEFEETKAQLIGQDDYVVEQLEEVARHRKYVSPEELQRLFAGFLRREVGGKSKLRQDEEEPKLFYLKTSPRFVDLLRGEIYAMGSAALDLLTQLEVGSSLVVTFDPEVAYRRRAEFMNLRHPFMKGILNFYAKDPERLLRGGKLSVLGPRSGDYLFFIFILEATGLIPRHQLVGTAADMETEAVDHEISDLVLPALSAQEPKDPPSRPSLIPDAVGRCYEAARVYAFTMREALKLELERTNDAIAVSRQESLEQSLLIRRHRIESYIDGASDVRIRRMRESQLSNLEGRVRAKIQDIESKKGVAVTVRPLAGGYLRVDST
jgi:SNF2 family DNA or RNA helicase